MAASETSISNMALGRIGAKRINALTDTTQEAIHCRLHYDQARDALLQSHPWAFARTRSELAEDATAPAFQWENQFILPSDFLRMIELYNSKYTWAIEGQRLLTDASTAQIRYVRKVTDAAAFSPLFIEALALSLAIRLVMPLSQDKTLRDQLEGEYGRVLARVQTVNRATGEGGDDRQTWQESRASWANTTE